MMRTVFGMFSNSFYDKKQSFSHFFINTTLPTCVCSLFLLLLLTILIINPISSIYTSTINSRPDEFVLGLPQTKAATQTILNYLWFGLPLTLDLSEQAILHMADVRTLFVLGQIMFAHLFVIVLFILLKRTKKQILDLLVRASASALFLIIIVAIISLLSFAGFDKMFTFFHQILFSNNLWLFAPNDTLILYFPQYFFQTIVKQMALWYCLSLVIILLFLKLKERQERFSSSKPAQHI